MNPASRLFATVAQWQNEPFAYGKHDCCLFAARCLDAMTGSQFADQLREHYTDEASALRFISDCGGIERAVSQFLGPMTAGFPGRGDVCLVETDGGLGVGISTGAAILVAADSGLAAYPIAACRGVWKWARLLKR